MSVNDNLLSFYEKLEKACAACGRSADDITVMAVSKTRSVEEITEAHKAGLGLFGENRVEEALNKFSDLDSSKYPLVLIGHLQSNKVTRISKRFSGVHSVDSLKLARRLSSYRESIRAPLDILLQVNTSGEESKSGFMDRGAFLEAASEVSGLPYLKLRGIMTMAPFVDDERVVRSCFAACSEWGEEMRPYLALEDAEADVSKAVGSGRKLPPEGYSTGNPSGPKLIISMGMSSDFHWAVAEGSNLLRIGTTIFGARN